MPASVSTELIFSRLQNEKATGELAPLQKDFYLQAEAFIAELSHGDASEERAKQLENAKRMVLALKERRKQKLLAYLAYGKSLPQPVPEEEEALYNEIRQILNRDVAKAKVSRLKIITSIPEVLTTEGKKIGPYQRGDIVEIADRNEAEFMIKNKIGEIIQ